ncbi:MAG: sugar ABC transporter permease [Elusimicrobia bacterium]|nr:sugar ABC transporter permease [Elusimicrobiota bacterium]
MTALLGSIIEVARFVAVIFFAIALLEAYLYVHFHLYDRRWFLPACVLAAAAAGLGAARLWAPDRFFELGLAAAMVETALAFGFIRLRGRYALAYMMLAPAILGLTLLIIYPLCFEVYLSFHDLKLTTIMQWSRTGALPFVGIKHFVKVFTSSPLSEVSFWQLFLRTIWWTFINVFFHVTGGFALALLLNHKIKLKGIYRTFLIIPWAMPQVVAVLAMRGEFHSQYGFINITIQRAIDWLPLLGKAGLHPIQWLTQHPFLTCSVINIWLGIPFMMVVILGGLQYGASAFQQFRMITLPLIKPVLAPAVTLGTVWTFNNINVIYLVTGQAGGTEDADIMVSALYKASFSFYRYSYSAAFAIVIFFILFAFAMAWLKWTRGTESVYERD